MSPERIAHARVKARIWQVLDREIRRQQLPCEALPDGITVEIGEDYDYEPDAIVNCGDRLPPDAIAASTPLIIVEVLSRSTRASDTGAKLADYFTLPSVRHYLLVRADRRHIIHHRRGDDGEIRTHIIAAGTIELDPPGIALGLDEIYAD